MVRHQITNAFSDWLQLLDGPRGNAFTELVEKEDWARLLKLLTLVLLLWGAVLGARLTVEALRNSPSNSIWESRLALISLLVGAILASAYHLMAKLFGIPITLSKSFFLILSLGLPWVPIFACIDAIPSLPQFKFIGVLFLVSHLILIKPLMNFYEGVRIITQCARWRALASILTPLTLFIALSLYMFGM